MSETTLPPMHSDFHRWYREVSVEENRERLQRRWTGLATVIQSLDQNLIENLLRIVFRSKSVTTPEAIQNFRQVFKTADDLFDMEGNDRELEVLSGSVLAVLLEASNDLSAWTAIAVTTSSLNGKRPLQLPMDLVAAAENSIARTAEANRKRPSLRSTHLDAPKLDFAKAKEKLTTIDGAGIGATLDTAAETINGSLLAMVRKVNASIQATETYIAIQDEELNMLWWVLGERSDGVKKAFGSIPEKERPLIFATELANATTFLPGPRSVEGLLTRAGLKSNKTHTIPDVINACNIEWLQTVLLEDSSSPLSQPIQCAIRRRLETQDDTSWISGWAAGCGVDATAAFPALTLGKLFYREQLLSIF